MRSIDLDARLDIARTEAGQDEGHTLKWRGREWALPPDIPLEFLTHLETPAGLPKALSLLLGGDVAALTPPVGLREAVAVTDAVCELYGMTAGESVASPGSSGPAGTRPKRTSPGTTGSRSARR